MRRYLELADWVLQDAVRSAKDDGEWERDGALDESCSSLRSGEIRITVEKSDNGGARLQAHGAGFQKKKAEKPKVTSMDATIATKTVKAQDVYEAGEQHNNYGVELKPISSSCSLGDK